MELNNEQESSFVSGQENAPPDSKEVNEDMIQVDLEASNVDNTGDEIGDRNDKAKAGCFR